MKPQTSFCIFLLLVVPSFVISGIKYMNTKENILNDLNQALAKTILKEEVKEVTTDTIRTYRNFLATKELRNCAYLAHCPLNDKSSTLCSDTMVCTIHERIIGLRAYANCSTAAIFGMSDQRIPSFLSLLAAVWGILSLIYFHRTRQNHSIEPISNTASTFTTDSEDLFYSAESHALLNKSGKPLHLTPMQRQLVTLFLSKPDYQVSTAEICETLWPKKDNAKDTLYTLIRRIKPVLEDQANIKIVSEKGGYYRLDTSDK